MQRFPGRAALRAGLCAAVTCLVAVVVPASSARAGYGGGYGGSSGDAIWALAWWAGSPEGPGPFTGPPASQAGQCIWHDVGPSVADLASALEESGLPASFWREPQGGGHPGIWGVLRWALGKSAVAAPTDHFDLVGCPAGSQVPASGGDVESELPAARLPDGRRLWLWAYFDTVADPPPSRLPAVVDRALGRARLPLPRPGTSPGRVDGIGHSSVVNVATWLWVDPSLWHSVSATASAGRITATVWAYPVSVLWEASWDFPRPSDDPEHATTLGPERLSKTCRGPGTRYVPGQAQQSTACSFVFREPTLGTWRQLHARVRWVVHWAVSGRSDGVVGGEGLLPAATTSRTVPLRVLQVESIIASG